MINTTQQKATPAHAAQRFTMIQRPVPNPGSFQFYFEMGMTVFGPWAQLGLNETEYVIGFPPQRILEGHRHREVAAFQPA